MNDYPDFQSAKSAMKPLSVGNVVSAGIRIYRDHFKLYFQLALQAYLWLIVPVYGWAKFSYFMGLISRLAYSEVLERPETFQDARRHVKPKMWEFFLASLLVSIIVSVALFAAIIVSAIIGGIFAAIFAQQSSPNLVGILIAVVFGLIYLFALIFAYVWLVSRLLIVELPLAIETNVDCASAIKRSWELTKGSVFRIQGVVFIAFLISIPISIVLQIASAIFQVLPAVFLPPDSPITAILYVLGLILVTVVGGAFMIPFWQAIKAVIYYDLRVRREGMGMEL